jgi:CTP:molybdopterin cytidylyltransferase MocA
MTLGCIVLAAGSSRRFGEDKLRADLLGKPVLGHVLDAVRAVRSLERRVLVTGPEPSVLLEAIDADGFAVVPCGDAGSGLSASLRCGIEALRGSPAALVLLGDQPLIGPAAIEAVIAARDPGRLATRAAYGGEPGHPVLIEAKAFERLLALRGDRGGREVLAGDQKLVDCTGLADPLDIDTSEDLATARARLGGASGPGGRWDQRRGSMRDESGPSR